MEHRQLFFRFASRAPKQKVKVCVHVTLHLQTVLVMAIPAFALVILIRGRICLPPPPSPTPQGQLGVFEGLTSDIDIHGKQPQSNGVRCDCITETSASFAIRAVLTGNTSDENVATNLLNYGA